jgi:small subunit ribosomal protein S20
VNKLREAIQAKDVTKAKDALSEAVREINRARSKGVLHRNTASRKISRLTQEFNALGPS